MDIVTKKMVAVSAERVLLAVCATSAWTKNMEINAKTIVHGGVLTANVDQLTVSAHASQVFKALGAKTVLWADMAVLVSTLAQRAAKKDNAISRPEHVNANSGLLVRNVKYVHTDFMAICADFDVPQDV